MQIMAIHTITDPERFWERASEGTKTLPAGVALQSVAPSQDGGKAICLWSAGSEAEVRRVVEEMVGAYSSNEFFPIDPANAVGLPAAAAAS
jgi:phosphoheptose isomerase